MARRKVTNGQFLREPWFRLGVTSILDALHAPEGSEHDLMNMSATSSGAIPAGIRCWRVQQSRKSAQSESQGAQGFRRFNSNSNERNKASALSGHSVIGLLEECHCIRLRAVLSFDYVELDFVTFFERFVPVRLNRRVVDEYIPSIFASDESEALGAVKPLNNSFVLCHKLLPSLPGISISFFPDASIYPELPRKRYLTSSCLPTVALYSCRNRITAPR